MIGLFYLFLIFVVYQKILNWLNEISQGYEKKKIMTIIQKGNEIIAKFELYKSESDNSKKWEVTQYGKITLFDASQYSILDLIEMIKK
jgi:hypothetical protein